MDAEYIVRITDKDSGKLEISAFIDTGLYQKNSIGEQAALVGLNAIREWIEANGQTWSKDGGTTVCAWDNDAKGTEIKAANNTGLES